MTDEPTDQGLKDWLRTEIDKEIGWFLRMQLGPDLVTPGWCDATVEKLPYFGLPEDMTGLRVLDVGCAEGFFSFEAERRGAKEVVAIDADSGGSRPGFRDDVAHHSDLMSLGIPR